MKNIGMVIAMQKELIPFLESSGTEIEKDDRFGFEIIKFRIGDNNIICVQSGIGEIKAAAATQLLISTYNAEVIINFGVCGSLADIGVAETVLVKGVVHYDYDLSPIAHCEVGRYPEFPSTVIDTDENLRKRVKKINPSIKEVICASADKFVADEEKKECLHKTYGAEICEMECAGVLMTSVRSSVPCLIIKAVSDGKGGAEEYEKMVHSASKAYLELINQLIRQ